MLHQPHAVPLLCLCVLLYPCRIKYYNNSLFHNIQRDFLAQTGDPSGTGKGGDSLYG